MRRGIRVLILCLMVPLLGAAGGEDFPAELLRLPGFGSDLRGEQPYAEITYLQASSTVELNTGRAHRTFILQALLHIPASVDAVGIAHQVEITELVDEGGRDVLNDERNAQRLIFVGPRNYGPISHHRRDHANQPISINTSLHGLARIPPHFQTIRGKAYVLLARRRVARELRPIRAGSVLELAPSLFVQVVEVKQEGQNVHVEFRYEAAEAGPFFNPNVEPPFVDAVKIVDDMGQEVMGRGSAPQRPQANPRLAEGEGRLTFTLDPHRQPQVLRFEVVTEVREREVGFVAHDVRMPIE